MAVNMLGLCEKERDQREREREIRERERERERWLGAYEHLWAPCAYSHYSPIREQGKSLHVAWFQHCGERECHIKVTTTKNGGTSAKVHLHTSSTALIVLGHQLDTPSWLTFSKVKTLDCQKLQWVMYTIKSWVNFPIRTHTTHVHTHIASNTNTPPWSYCMTIHYSWQ